MRAPLALVAVLALLAAPAAGLAATPRASLPDIEDEVMCLECGTALNVSTSKVADQEREFIAQLIAQGKTKAQIKAELVQEYGPRVLGEPDDGGFDLAAYLVPVLVALGATALVVLTARRWRRRAPQPAAAAAGPAVSDDELQRLDDDLKRFG